MKNVTKLIVLLLLPSLMWSCKKDEKRDIYIDGTAPVLKANLSGNIPLSFLHQNDQAITLSWTNPNYQFTTGISSQNVTYTLELDTTGSNFTNPNKQVISISNDLSYTFTQSQLNDNLSNQLQLSPAVSHNIEFRVTASLNDQLKVVSNVLKFTATPYVIPPKVAPPAGGHLYLVGSATAGGWNNPVPIPTQEFTQVSQTLYQITINLTGGQEYLFLPVNGDWSHKYSVPDKTVAGLNGGGDFKLDASDNFPGPTATGTYKITVDFQRGKFTVVKQ